MQEGSTQPCYGLGNCWGLAGASRTFGLILPPHPQLKPFGPNSTAQCWTWPPRSPQPLQKQHYALLLRQSKEQQTWPWHKALEEDAEVSYFHPSHRKGLNTHVLSVPVQKHEGKKYTQCWSEVLKAWNKTQSATAPAVNKSTGVLRLHGACRHGSVQLHAQAPSLGRILGVRQL